MELIDVHCHLDLCGEDKIDGIINRAKKAGLMVIVSNGANPERNRMNLDIAENYKKEEIVKVALGMYPIDALSLSEEKIDEEIKFIKNNKEKIVAIGEVGLDYKEDKDNIERQKNIFIKLIRLAIKLDKPLIVHSRKAELECIEILEKEKAKKVIMHCFCGKHSLVKRIVLNNWFLTIPTNVKSSEHFQKVIELVPLQQLLCETDSPFLHPDKMRDNEPANVVESYNKIAEIKKIPLEEVSSKIKENYKTLFLSDKH